MYNENMTYQEAVERIKVRLRVPPELVEEEDYALAIEQALKKLTQRTGGYFYRTGDPPPNMTVVRNPILDEISYLMYDLGGTWAGYVPWDLQNIEKHQGVDQYFLDLAVEYVHLAVAGRYAIADGFQEFPFQLEFRNIYEMANQRINEIDQDLKQNFIVPVL